MGSRSRVGIEDGCRGHGTMKLMRAVATIFSFLLLALSISVCFSCSRTHGQAAPDAATRLASIATTDATKLPALGPSKHWSNPYLVIRPESVALLTNAAPNEEQMLKPAEVLDALAHLPSSAWPYGRAVAILVRTGSSDQEKAAILRNRGIVEGDLEGAHVAIRWIPNQ